MTTGFTPIQLHDYVELHLRANPDADRAELIEQLADAIVAHSCITGQAAPDQDYEIAVAEESAAR